MEKNVYKEIYDFIKEWGPDMVASELSAIAHMADKLTKDEIVLRCVAIRNALWDIEDEKMTIFKAESEIKQEEIKIKEALGAME